MSLQNRTDEDLVADVRMLVGELSKLCVELGKRDIEVNLLNYEGGAVKVHSVERVKKEKL